MFSPKPVVHNTRHFSPGQENPEYMEALVLMGCQTAVLDKEGVGGRAATGGAIVTGPETAIDSSATTRKQTNQSYRRRIKTTHFEPNISYNTTLCACLRLRLYFVLQLVVTFPCLNGE